MRPTPLLLNCALVLIPLLVAASQATAQNAAPSTPAAAVAPQAQPAPKAAGPGLTLNDAINQALSTSNRIRASEADRGAQREKRRGAWSDIGPRVSASYNEAHYKDAQEAEFGGAPLLMRPEVARAGSLTVAQPITGLWGLVDKARYEGIQLDMKDASVKLTRSDVAFSTAQAWLGAYNVQRQVEIAEASVSAAESQRRDGAALERAGRMNHGDVLKLDLAVSEAKARLAQTRANREIGFGQLKEAIGLTIDAQVELSPSLPAVPNTVPDTGAAMKEALGKRLEAQQAESGVTAAGFYKKLAYTNFTPSVGLFWKWDHTFGDLSALAGERDTKYYGVQATWDIWNNGSHVFAVREAAQGVVAAEETARGVDQSIRLDVLQAVANLKAAQESLALAETAVSQAEEAYRIEQARFRTGSRSATDLILAETSQASARGRLVTAQTDLVLWHLKTQKALGVEQPQL